MSESMNGTPDSASLTRRQALALLGAAGAVSLAGCPTTDDASTTDTGNNSNTNSSDGSASCVLTPEQTEGPYFNDEMLNRSDIRSDPGTGAVQDGTPLRLRIAVSKLSNGSCSALENAQVDVWHCNSQGLYSDQAANNTVGQKFLRGFQLTGADGVVEFTTIYPGWYSGRTVHIHFKIRSGSLEFNSQLYFDPAVTSAVYAKSPYASRGQPDTSNSRDNIYDAATLLNLSADGDGYLGTFSAAVELT